MPKLPKISVVIPARDRPDQLRRCLAQLAPGAQSLDSDRYEVVVTDDSRGPEVQELVQTEAPWARWVPGPRRGPAANRNSGAKAALGEWIVFTDDDCVPQRRWLEAFNEAMRPAGPDLLEGKTVCPDRRNTILEETVENLHGGNFWTCNLAVRRSVFSELLGFDEDFLEAAQEDTEFAARALARGIKTEFVVEAAVHHAARTLTIRQLWRRALMVRWLSLYHLKTRRGWMDQRLPVVLIRVCLERAANLLREHWKALGDWRAHGFGRTFFHLAWKTLTFPLLLPYVLWWEVRFRANLLSRRERCFDSHAVEMPATS